jgi:hypothetical protein
MLHHVTLVRTDVSEEPSASFIRVTRIEELGTTLAATSNRRRLRASVPLMIYDQISSQTLVLKIATGLKIPEDTILQSHRREKINLTYEFRDF